jgi:hypothetical protein
MEDFHMFDHCVVVNFCSDMSNVSILALHKHRNNPHKFTPKHLLLYVHSWPRNPKASVKF